MVGRVLSTKMQKSVTVIAEFKKQHPLYKKSFWRSKKYLVDDQIGVKKGDIVVFEKIRPISKHKHWGIIKVLGQDFISLQEAELKESATEAIAAVLPEETGPETSDENQKISETDEDKKEEKPKRERKTKSLKQ